MLAREINLHEIQDLVNQNMGKSNQVNDTQESLKQFIHNDQQLGITFNDTAVQNKTVRVWY